jgi:hypothetical protein
VAVVKQHVWPIAACGGVFHLCPIHFASSFDQWWAPLTNWLALTVRSRPRAGKTPLNRCGDGHQWRACSVQMFAYSDITGKVLKCLTARYTTRGQNWWLVSIETHTKHKFCTYIRLLANRTLLGVCKCERFNFDWPSILSGGLYITLHNKRTVLPTTCSNSLFSQF